MGVLGKLFGRVAAMALTEGPYTLEVDKHEAVLRDRFGSRRAYVYLSGEGSRDAIWILQTVGWNVETCLPLFGSVWGEQQRFKRREEAIRHVETVMGITRTTPKPPSTNPPRGMTPWEAEDASAPREGTRE